MRKHLAAPAIRSALVVGGTDPRAAKAQLRGGAHIVTGTPGMLVTFVLNAKPVMPCDALSKVDRAGQWCGNPIRDPESAAEALPGSNAVAQRLARCYNAPCDCTAN